MLKSFENLLINGLIRFCKILSSFRMSNDNVFNTNISKHVRSDFSGVSTFLLIIHIFSTDFDVASLSSFNSGDDINCRHTEYYVSIFCCYKRL